MNDEQLNLLRSTRPSGQDEHEADVVAARAAAALQTGLSARLDEERQTDLAMQQALRSVEPPAGFETAMLTAMRAARGLTEPPAALRETVLTAVQMPSPPVVAGPGLSRRRWLGLGAAAAAAALAGGWWWRENHAFSLRRLSRTLAAITKEGVTLSLMSMDTAAVTSWLREHQAPRPDALPEKFATLGRKGCHIYTIEGHQVSLECLLLSGMRELHLFCTPAAGLIGAPGDGAAPQLSRVAGRTLATWTRGPQTMLLLSQALPEEIQALLV